MVINKKTAAVVLGSVLACSGTVLFTATGQTLISNKLSQCGRFSSTWNEETQVLILSSKVYGNLNLPIMTDCALYVDKEDPNTTSFMPAVFEPILNLEVIRING
jgi:hypothetical protein